MSLQKNVQVFWKLGEKTLKIPRISWVFPKSGTGGELIYSDFANRSSMKLYCENKSLQKNVQLFWKLGGKNSQKSKDFVIFPQKWNWGRVNLFWFCQSLKYEIFLWKNKFEKKRAIILKVRGKNSQKSKDFVTFPQKWSRGRVNLFWFCQSLTCDVFWGK